MMEQVVSHYRIIKKLGAGGMGEVFLAEDTSLGRRVALKLLPRQYTQDEERLRRFKLEARAASALNHPNILTIHEVGEADGHHFIATEFIEGETLRAALNRTGSMKIDAALNVATQVASALAAAHEAGIVHRDIKPENIMLRPDGYVKVLDFGLAKLTETIPQQTVDTSAPTLPLAALTATGVLIGTAQYMSPEQATGKKVDARSDIFSFGVVLYEMVTGRQAFRGDSLMETVAAILNQEPKSLPAKVPDELSKLILRCLRKEPARRFQTMADLKVALEDLRDESRSVPHLRISRGWLWIGAGLLSILLAAAVFMWRARPAPESMELRAEALTTFPGQELYPSFSPDGDRVAFTWTGPKQDNTDIWVQQIGSGSPLRLTSDSQTDYNPVWSPDGRWIAFLRGDPATPLGRSDRELRLIPPLGGPERKLADVRVQEITDVPVYLTWCADSRCLIVTDSLGEGQPDALFVVSIETGEKRQLTKPQPPVVADTNPALSPDGRSLLFLRRTTWARGELHVVRVHSDMTAAGEPKHIESPRLLPDTATWMPSGDEILFTTNPYSGSAALWRVSAAGGGKPSRMPFVGEDGVMPAVSRSQPGKPVRMVYVRSFTDENISRIDFSGPGVAATAAPAIAIASSKSEMHPQLSPDGRRVVFTSTRSGAWEIWVSDLDGSNSIQLTFLRAPTGTGAPAWSPDGGTIVFASDVEGQFDIFTVPSAGGKPRNITSHPGFDHVPVFSRDGQWIYFSSTRSGKYQVWKLPVLGGEAVPVTRDGGWHSHESVDGMDLYFLPTAAIGATTELWRMPTSGGQAVKVVDGVVNATFAVIQQGIYYLTQSSSGLQLQFFDFTRQKPVTVARDLGTLAEVGGFGASADGRIILYARRDSAVDDLMLVENFR